MEKGRQGQEGNLGGAPKTEMRLAKLSATIGRRLRGDFSDVDPNDMRIATICMISMIGVTGLWGMYVGLSMVDNAIRDIPAKYINLITRAAVGGIITMSAIASGIILAVSVATRYWPRK